jgi:hypothetical protein
MDLILTSKSEKELLCFAPIFVQVDGDYDDISTVMRITPGSSSRLMQWLSLLSVGDHFLVWDERSPIYI